MAITTAYKTGIKKQVVSALKPTFGPTLPDERYRNIYVGLEFPLEQVHYPAILVTYSEGPIRNVGVGHYEFVVDDNLITAKVKHFYFEGSLNFNILALNPTDRDNLSAIVINMLALGKNMPEFLDFWERLETETYVPLRLMTDVIDPGGEQVNEVPWQSEDERLFSNRYSVQVFGEFLSDPDSGDLIEIDTVELFPYEFGTPPPW
jgi:hypothetical protein